MGYAKTEKDRWWEAVRKYVHTPGPWQAKGGFVDAVVEQNKSPKPICECTRHTFQGVGEAEANAWLVAAAPDLLHLVIEAEGLMPLGTAKRAQWVERAGAVIANAQGR
jgi:hypothetical protein